MKIKILYLYLLLLFISLFSFSSNVYADLCDSDYIKDLKKLAEQVSVNYEYLDNKSELYRDYITKENFNDEIIDDVYYVDVDLKSSDMYLFFKEQKYYFNGVNNGKFIFTTCSGEQEIEIRSTKCWNKKLRTIRLKLPKFNMYSYRIECKDLLDKELDVCDSWYQGAINEEIFSKEVSKYLKKEENSIVKFLKNNYLYFIVGFLLLIFLVIFIINRRKKTVLE